MLKNALVCVKSKPAASLLKRFIDTRFGCQPTAKLQRLEREQQTDLSCRIWTRDSKKAPGLGCGLGTESSLCDCSRI